MRKTTRIDTAVLGLGMWLGCAVLSRSALACPPCPDGLVESSVAQSLTYGQEIDFPDGGVAGSGFANNFRYGPNDPTTLRVDLSGGAWCVAAFTTDFTCYVETSGFPVSDDDGRFRESSCQATTPAENPNAVAFAMYCNVRVQ